MTADSVVGLIVTAVLCRSMSPTWIWLQAAIIVLVLIGMVIAITKLA